MHECMHKQARKQISQSLALAAFSFSARSFSS